MNTTEVRELVSHAYTIDTLIAELTRLRATEGGDAPIILDMADSPHEFSPVCRGGCVYVGMYHAECTWTGERFMTPEVLAADPEYDEDDEAPEGSIRAIFIGPTN